MPRSFHYRIVAVIASVLAVAGLAVWSGNLPKPAGWDLRVYQTAARSIRAGHDPYADGIAVQRAYHVAQHPEGPPPFTYVYSPITLPLLGGIARLPQIAAAVVYWALYIAGTVVAILIGLRFLLPEERPLFTVLAPAALVFPGLAESDAIFSGNLAYLLYALVLLAARRGWESGRWLWFYLAVLASSCFKAPLLALLAIPVFSAPRQWRNAIVTGVAGIALFAVQPLLWPALFKNYLEAVELQFSYNHDFGSPAGMLADALYQTVPYRVTNAVVYLLYAIPTAALLFYLSRRYFAGRFNLSQWMPVLLTGVILLNPRIMEYDAAPITLPMALIAWRFLHRGQTVARAVTIAAFCFLAWNLAGLDMGWRAATSILLPVVLAVGAWDLLTLPAPADTMWRFEPPAQIPVRADSDRVVA